MTDVSRETYRALMAEIDDLETRVADLAKEVEVAADSPNPADATIAEEELAGLRTTLAEKRNELARISDGCGRPHPQG